MIQKKLVENVDATHIKQTFLYVLAAYAMLAVAFYFLAGDQLRYRVSRGEREMLEANVGSVELSSGASVEQVFTAQIDRLERVCVRFGTYYRANAGTLTMELRRQSDGEMLLHQEYDVSAIAEGQTLEMTSEIPVENLGHAPLVLRLTADSALGMGVTPLISLNWGQGSM